MPVAPGRFPTTSWTLVLTAAKVDARRSALGLLCESYWPPVFAYVRRHVADPEEAKDLTQGFFARLIEKRDLGALEREHGRFRSYLLACVKHFIANERDRARAQKRGGGRPELHIDVDADDSGVPEAADTLTPERVFERRWALLVLDRALRSVKRRYEATDQLQQFERLKGSLVEAPGGYREAAQQLGMSEGAVKMAVLRLRRRFATALRAEIALTVAAPGDIEDEIAHLMQALRAKT